MMNATRAIFTAVILALLLTDARADWRFEAESGAFYDSNLSKSDRGADEKDDWAWKTNLRVGDGLQLARDFRLTLAADLRSAVWDCFDAFDQIGGGVSAGLRYRFGLGRQAPWLLLEERIGYDVFRETFRNGWDETLHLRGGFFLTERLAFEAGYRFENFAARDKFFDLQGHRAEARLVLDVTSSLQVALGYTYRDGEIIAYAVPPRPELAAIAVEREDTSTFGTNPRYTAYRLRGETHAVSISASYALRKYFSIQVSYEYAATTHDPLQYENHFVAAKLAFAY